MGILLKALGRGGDAHFHEHLLGAFPCLFFIHLTMRGYCFYKLFSDGHNRIQPCHGVLKYHGDLVTTDLAYFLLVKPGQVFSLKQDLSRCDLTGLGRNQPQN